MSDGRAARSFGSTRSFRVCHSPVGCRCPKRIPEDEVLAVNLGHQRFPGAVHRDSKDAEQEAQIRLSGQRAGHASWLALPLSRAITRVLDQRSALSGHDPAQQGATIMALHKWGHATGTALLMSGPIGWVLGAIIGLVGEAIRSRPNSGVRNLLFSGALSRQRS